MSLASPSPAPEPARSAGPVQQPIGELPWILNADAPPMELTPDQLLDLAGMEAFPSTDPPRWSLGH